MTHPWTQHLAERKTTNEPGPWSLALNSKSASVATTSTGVSSPRKTLSSFLFLAQKLWKDSGRSLTTYATPLHVTLGHGRTVSSQPNQGTMQLLFQTSKRGQQNETFV